MSNDKYVLKPKNKLKQVKEMLVAAKLSPDEVLSNWLALYCCNGTQIHEMTVEENLSLLGDMLSSRGHNLNECLKDWKANYRKKRIHSTVEKYRPDQQAFFDKWKDYTPKSLGEF